MIKQPKPVTIVISTYICQCQITRALGRLFIFAKLKSIATPADSQLLVIGNILWL